MHRHMQGHYMCAVHEPHELLPVPPPPEELVSMQMELSVLPPNHMPASGGGIWMDGTMELEEAFSSKASQFPSRSSQCQCSSQNATWR